MKRNLQLPTQIIVFLSFALVFSSCDSAALDQFRGEAELPASGITRILEGGDICSVDEDDWRTSPAYQGDITIDRGAFPNPASGAIVTISVRIHHFDRVNGSLHLYADLGGDFLTRIADIFETSVPALRDFQFSSSVLRENGLHRLIIFDGTGEIVSYGDLELAAEQPRSC